MTIGEWETIGVGDTLCTRKHFFKVVGFTQRPGKHQILHLESRGKKFATGDFEKYEVAERAIPDRKQNFFGEIVNKLFRGRQ